MTAPRWLDADEQEAWRGWLDVNAGLSALLNRELQEASGLSLADYDVLVALTDEAGGNIRMRELGEKLRWEKSRLSKQLTRMEARGLVARRECAEDRRAAYVDLTEAGLAAIRAAAPDHVALVRRMFFEGLTPEQVRELATITAILRDRLAAETATGR